jgi:hypothetical protein
LVCRRCHEIVMPRDTAQHDSACEMNQVLPSSAHHSIQATSSPLVATGSAPEHAKSNAKRSGHKAAASKPCAPPVQAARQVFSISDIQARFQAKRLAITNKPFTGRTRKSTSSCSSAGSDSEEEHVMPLVKRSNRSSHSSSSESDVVIASPPESASPPTCVRPNRRLLTARADEKKPQGKVGCAVTRKRSVAEVVTKKGNNQQVIAAKRSRGTPTAPPSSRVDQAHDYCWECGLSGGTMQVLPASQCFSLSLNSLYGCSCALDQDAACAYTRFAPGFNQKNSDGACARAAATRAWPPAPTFDTSRV